MWPSEIRRAVLACRAGETPKRTALNRWQPDSEKADAAYDAMMARIAEYEDDHRVASDAICMPCQDDAEARYFAMARIHKECDRDEQSAAEKEARAQQSRAAASGPRDRKSPFPEWMLEIAAQKRGTKTTQMGAVADRVLDAIRSEIAERGGSVPTRKTVLNWLKAD